jgi:hypothetical protein
MNVRSGNRNVVVVWLLGSELKYPDFDFRLGREIFLFSKRWDLLWGLSTIGPELLSPAIKRLDGEADHSFLPFVEDMSDWGSPILPICLRGMHSDDLTCINVRNSGNFLIKLTFYISIFFVGDVFGCSWFYPKQ